MHQIHRRKYLGVQFPGGGGGYISITITESDIVENTSIEYVPCVRCGSILCTFWHPLTNRYLRFSVCGDVEVAEERNSTGEMEFGYNDVQL